MDEGVLTHDSNRISINFFLLFDCHFELLLEFFKLFGMILFCVFFLLLEDLALGLSPFFILISFLNLGFNVISVLIVLFLVLQHPHLLVNFGNIFLHLLLLVLIEFDLLKENLLFFFEIEDFLGLTTRPDVLQNFMHLVQTLWELLSKVIKQIIVCYLVPTTLHKSGDIVREVIKWQVILCVGLSSTLLWCRVLMNQFKGVCILLN